MLPVDKRFKVTIPVARRTIEGVFRNMILVEM
jgi:hypothetical protein